MTSTITIGRVGIDVPVSAITLWEDSDDVVNVTGHTTFGSLANALTVRQQLMGYTGSSDEPFVPVTWSLRPSVNGFYKVLSVTVTPNASGQWNGWYDFALTLQPVQGFAAPSFESVILGALRVNSAGIVTGTSIPWQGLPAAISGYAMSVLNPSVKTRVASDGNVLVFSEATNALYNDRPYFWLPPASWYTSACTLTMGGVVQVGRQVANTPEAFVISNGLVRVTSSFAATSFLLTLEAYDGTAWRTIRLLNPGGWNGSTGLVVGHAQTLTVLRNSPEEVVVRVAFDVSTIITGRATINLDLSLRRGARMLTGVISSKTSFNWALWALYPQPLLTMSGLTAGWRRTANDSDGNRILFASAMATTYDGSLGLDAFYSTASVKLWDFAVGLEVGGTAATTTDAAQSLIYQYMAAQNEKVTVVAR